MKVALAELQEAVRPVLQVADPKMPVDCNPGTFLERLREAPRRLKAWAKRAATKGSQQVLVLVCSHYSRVDVRRLEEGLAEDTSDEQVRALLEETKCAAESLSRRVHLY